MSKQAKQITYLTALCALFVCSIIVFAFVDAVWYVEAAVYAVLYLACAYKTIWSAIRKITRLEFLDEDFLMCIASIGAFIIGEYSEAVAVMLFFSVGEWFEHYAIRKSRKAIKSLLDIRPQFVRIEKGESEEIASPSEVKKDDIIVVKAGEKIAVDGIVVFGSCALDSKAITGESKYREVSEGDEVLSGCIATDGMIKVKAKAEYADSTVAKILDMVENATANKSSSEKFITRFARIYTPIVVALALLIAVVPPIFDGGWRDWIFKALAFLVVSCPCAMVISVPLAYFASIGKASSIGVLIKGSNRIEKLAKSDVFVFDKTGTITEGEFEVFSVEPRDRREEILSCAYACEKGSSHPLARCILKECKPNTEVYEIEESAGKGVIARREGEEILVGNDKLLRSFGIKVQESNKNGTVVFVAKNGEYLGCIACRDKIKQNASEAIGMLNSVGKTVMLSGDNAEIALEVASSVGISETVAGLLPQDKAEIISKMRAGRGKNSAVVYVGDGINDAPALVSADVGVAMGKKGSNVAVESADVVLMHDDISALFALRALAKRTVAVSKQNVVFALAVKVAVMALTAVLGANMWLAVFADVGVSLLAILNSLRLLKKTKNK